MTEFRDTPWDRDARAALAAMIRQVPLAQLPGIMPSLISGSIEIADKLAVERQKRMPPPLKMPVPV